VSHTGAGGALPATDVPALHGHAEGDDVWAGDAGGDGGAYDGVSCTTRALGVTTYLVVRASSCLARHG
jgi:hypothetical protein